MNRDAKIGLFAVLVLVVLVAVMWAKLAGEGEPEAADSAATGSSTSAGETMSATDPGSLVDNIFRTPLESDSPFEDPSAAGRTGEGTWQGESTRPGRWSSDTGSHWDTGVDTASTDEKSGTYWGPRKTEETATGTTDKATGTFESLFGLDNATDPEDDADTSMGREETDTDRSSFLGSFDAARDKKTATETSGFGTTPWSTNTTRFNRFGRTLPEWPKEYTVVEGDTLVAISKKYYASDKHWRLIADANKTILPDPARLRVGMTIKIPQPPPTYEAGLADATSPTPRRGLKYTVKKGDTLTSIARTAYGSGNKWRTIFNANQAKLSSPEKLAVGTVISLPAGTEVNE